MTRARTAIRSARASDARQLHRLITANREEGHLLPRTLGEVKTHADRFVVAVRGRSIIGCAELAPLSPHLAEIRSLVVNGATRGTGLGNQLVEELRRRARRSGFERLCAFTHAPGYFVGMGFSIVPHEWLLEKLFTDCVRCPLFRQCGQYAMIVSLERTGDMVEPDDMRDQAPRETPRYA
jgi:amino-acid N-acetyltransferase